jgi:hypothetical protein
MKNETIKITINYAGEANKLGRHNLSFKTGAFERKYKNSKRDRREWKKNKNWE